MGSSTYAVTEQEAAAVGGIMGFVLASLAVISVIAIIYAVLTIIARWKVFTKAGEAGWKSIIPIYSDYIEWKLSWTNINLFWAMLGLTIVGAVLNSMGSGSASANGGMNIMSIIGAVAILAGAVIALIQKYKLFLSFGKGIGWFIGYIFLNNIMILVLGLGSSEYQGPQD
jgi:hypothetical protein